MSVPRYFRRRPSGGTVLAALALFVALGGTSYAVTQLPPNSVGSAQVKDGSLLKRDINANVVKGLRGPAGPAGIAGPQGPAGPQGAKGDTGPQGAKGATGETGAQGVQGVQGIQGPKGATGASGPVEYKSVTSGDLWIDNGHSGELTVNAPAGWGIVAGGYEVVYSGGTGGAVLVPTASFPVEDGWTIKIQNIGTEGGTFKVVGVAVPEAESSGS